MGFGGPGTVGEEDGVGFWDGGWSYTTAAAADAAAAPTVWWEGSGEETVAGGVVVGCLEAVVGRVAEWEVRVEEWEEGG